MDLVAELLIDTLLNPIAVVTATVVSVLLISGAFARMVDFYMDWR